MQAEFEIDLEAFSGPMDLLMHLIEKNKIDIYDIPIGLLTDQYMAAIESMQLDMDSNSEFLVMASTLLYLKAKSLLPADEEEDEEEVETKDELVRRLIEYKMFQDISKELERQQEDTGSVVCRKEDLPLEVKNYREPVDLDILLDGLDQSKLHSIFRMLMLRQEKLKDPVRSTFGKIKKEPLKIGDCITRIVSRLGKGKRCMFTELLEDGGRFEVVVTFLAMLELMKAGRVHITQDDQFGDILMEATELFDQVDDELLAGLTEY